MQLFHFISFGSDAEYQEQSRHIVSGLSRLYPGSLYKVYKPEHLPPQFQDYARSHRRGYGYWIWKPWIIRRTLRLLRPGDVLMYVDGRFGLAASAASVGWLDEFAANAEFDLAAWQLKFPEKHWTSNDLIARFGSLGRKDISDSGQFAGGLHAWRVNQRSMRLAHLWCEFMVKHPASCRDGPFRLPNDPAFVENRHDQSVFSLIVKKLNAAGDLRVSLLDGRRIKRDGLLAHWHEHPNTPTNI